MTATNHALTGAIIGLTITNPVLAIPLAFASHFILDSLPHFGTTDDKNKFIGSRFFKQWLLRDAILCIILVLVLAIAHPRSWLLAAICAFIAAAPDLMWIKKFMAAQKGKKVAPPTGSIARFHSWIQWFEQPIGLVVEIVWATAAIVVITLLVKH